VIRLLLSLTLAGPLPDPETPNPFLIQAKELYEALDFEKCMQRIKQAAAWKGSSVRDLRDVELFGGLCALNLGQRAEAAERFKLALRIDEDLELPEFASPKAVKLFLYVKRKLRQPTVAPMPDEDLPADAPTPAKLEAKNAAGSKNGEVEKPIEVTSPSGVSRHVPAILLGVGALAFGGVAIGLGVNAKSLETQARAQRMAMTFESEYLVTRGQALGNATAANVIFGVAGALAVAALVVLIMTR
jgi:hypothetical protein